jgi:hypothetical protein
VFVVVPNVLPAVSVILPVLFQPAPRLPPT